jgi:hypothetical protein
MLAVGIENELGQVSVRLRYKRKASLRAGLSVGRDSVLNPFSRVTNQGRASEVSRGHT